MLSIAIDLYVVHCYWFIYWCDTVQYVEIMHFVTANTEFSFAGLYFYGLVDYFIIMLATI